MRLLVIILAISAVLLGMTSCARGGNIDKGDDGIIGEHRTTGDENDGTYDERRDGNDGIIDDDYDMTPDINSRRSIDRNDGNVTDYNNGSLPGDIRRGVDNFGNGGMMPEGIFPDAVRR